MLETRRLRLRPLAERDRRHVLRAMNDLAVAQWLAPVPFPYGEGDFDDFLRGAVEGGTDFAVEDGGGFVGVIGCAEALGFWLVPGAQGRGYATEAARAVLARRFARDPSEVTSGYFEGNVRSARVLEKLGFVVQGRREVACRALRCVRPHIDLRLTAACFAGRTKPFA